MKRKARSTRDVTDSAAVCPNPGISMDAMWILNSFVTFEHITGESTYLAHYNRLLTILYSSGPQPFWHQGPVSRKTIFLWMVEGRGGFRIIQVHYLYCALYFYYYYLEIYNEIIIQPTIMQNQWEPWACFHLSVTDRVLMWVCKQLTYYGLCAVKPLC